MTPSHSPSRTLSEIGHLFLTDLRQKQGGPRPHRTPPPSNSSPNLTPAEFENACQVDDAPPSSDKPGSPITALLSSHLADREAHWIRSYARQAALTAGRVGLIEIDADELKIACFDRAANFDAQAVQDTDGHIAVEPLDERRMAQAMEELAWDVDRWLLFVHAPRSAQARTLLRLVNQWTLLATADHEGVVAAYRTIKGLFSADRPDLSLVILDAPDAEQASGIHQKLSGVCLKFLDCPVRAETPLRHVADVQQTAVLHCRGSIEKPGANCVESDKIATGAHWKVVADFLAALKHSSHRIADAHSASPAVIPHISPTESPAPVQVSNDAATEMPKQSDVTDQPGLIPAAVEALPIPPDESAFDPASFNNATGPSDGAPFRSASSSPPKVPDMPGPRLAEPQTTADADVLDLPDGDSPEMSILAAVLGSAGQFIRCPIAPPDCPASIVAVSRDKRLTLLAVAGRGLSDLRRIAAAFQWMRQNRDLIVMALPQFSISAAAPVLRLLVDQADLNAGLLHPFLAGGGVTIQPYRKLRWGRKTGLLLEAA